MCQWPCGGCCHFSRRKCSLSSSLAPRGTPYTEGREGEHCLYKAISEGEQGTGKKGWLLIIFSLLLK